MRVGVRKDALSSAERGSVALTRRFDGSAKYRRCDFFDVVGEVVDDFALSLGVVLQVDAARPAGVDDVQGKAAMIGNEGVALVAPRFTDGMNGAVVVGKTYFHAVETGFEFEGAEGGHKKGRRKNAEW